MSHETIFQGREKYKKVNKLAKQPDFYVLSGGDEQTVKANFLIFTEHLQIPLDHFMMRYY